MHHENEKMALFEALYREYLVPLKKYAYRIGVGYDDIEDMVHEAFIEYYKRYSLDLPPVTDPHFTEQVDR